MHRALSVQEIVREICAFSAGDVKSLAALARTCRDNHELAIQELWKEIKNLVPLVKCLPEDSWTVVTGELVCVGLASINSRVALIYACRHSRVHSCPKIGGVSSTTPSMSVASR